MYVSDFCGYVCLCLRPSDSSDKYFTLFLLNIPLLLKSKLPIHCRIVIMSNAELSRASSQSRASFYWNKQDFAQPVSRKLRVLDICIVHRKNRYTIESTNMLKRVSCHVSVNFIVSAPSIDIGKKISVAPGTFLYIFLLYTLLWCAHGFTNTVQYTME